MNESEPLMTCRKLLS